MKQCIKCLNEDVSTVVQYNRIYYRCNNCGSTEKRVMDKSGQIVSSTENGLVKHVTVAALIKRGNQIALVNRKNFPYGLCFPCGHLEYGESPSKGLEREVVEELGLTVQSKKLIFHDTILDQCKAGADLHEWYLYDCKTNGQIVLNSETDKLDWVNIKQLENLDIVTPARIVMSKLGLISHAPISPYSNFPALAESQFPSRAKTETQSAIENLPIAIILFDCEGKPTFENNSATALLSNLEQKNLREKFSQTVSQLVKEAIENKTEISRKIFFKKDVFNLALTPMKSRGQTKGVSATIKNISVAHKQDIKDVISYQTSLTLSGSSDSYKIIKSVLSQLMLSFEASNIGLVLIEKSKFKTIFEVNKNLRLEKSRSNLKVSQKLVEDIVKSQHLIAIPDTSCDARFSNQKEHYSLLSLPIIISDKVTGILNVARPKNMYFEEDEVNMATMVANRIALALENEQLYKSLRSEKLTLEKVLGTTTDGLIMVDKRFNLIFANEAAIKLLPLREVDLKNKSVECYLSGLSKENSEKMRRYLLESIGKRKKIEVEFISHKGQEKVVRARFTPVIQKNKKCDSALIGFANITKLINKQTQVEQQVKQLTALFKISSLSISSSIKFFNQVLKKTALIVDSEKSGLVVFDQKTMPEFAQSKDPEIDKLLTQIGEKYKFNIDFICNNVKSNFRDIKNISRILVAPVLLNGKTIGIVYVVNKNSQYTSKDRKLVGIISGRLASRIETTMLFNELQKDRQQIEKIIENSGDGIIVRRSFDSKVIVWNKAMEQITGFKTNKESTDVNPHISQFVRDAIEEGQSKHEDKVYKELKYFNSDNQEQWLGVNFSFIRNEDGTIEHVISNVRDISKDKITDERNKEFIYTTTHELRTPITAIKGYLSMILNGDAGKINAKQKKYFCRAFQSTENLVSLVEDLLKTAKIEENKLSMDKRAFNLNDLMLEVMNDFKQKAADKNLRFILAKSNTNETVRADYRLIKQALANLVDNAIKYTTERGTVAIKAGKSGNSVILSVEDTGVGIPKKEQESVFTKFYRVPNSESVKAGGTGLGLFIVKNLIEKQGGKIEIDSTLGKGTKISILLPLIKQSRNKEISNGKK